MTERKWTKGPWVTVGWDDLTVDVVTADGEELIATLESGNVFDAVLFAAAPDLYEALEMCERLAGDLNIDEWQQVMDALAKARGEK